MLLNASISCSNIWFKAATVVAVVPPVKLPTGTVLRSALAGGFACALSAAIMHPVDTIKVKASTFLQLILCFHDLLMEFWMSNTEISSRIDLSTFVSYFSV